MRRMRAAVLLASAVLVLVLGGGCDRILGLADYSLCNDSGAGGCGGGGGSDGGTADSDTTS